MAGRLPIDSHLLGYWGFDEANPTDVGIDNSQYGNTLTVTAAAGVLPARVGNGRQFDGTSTVASPASSDSFRTWRDGTLIAWVSLDLVNQSGDLLRPIVSMDGASGSHDDNTVFALAVDNTGAIVYRYDLDGPFPVVFKTAAGLIKTGRYYFVALTQTVSGEGATVQLVVDNKVIPWASVTVHGVPQGNLTTGPVPPATGATSSLKVGGSNKSASKWDGVIDELSVHDVARSLTPYLKAAYFAVTQSLSYSRLTDVGTIKTVGTVDTGGGNRWWCYERDGSIYVIRENSLGLFSPEVLLTSGGTSAQGAPLPGGVEQPRLVYDSVNDVVLVIFVSGGRVFKLTAGSGDAPSTQNMPVTADVATIIKVKDFTENYRFGAGSESFEQSGSIWDNSPAPAVAYLKYPTFGIAWGSSVWAPGYAVYKVSAGEYTFWKDVKTPQNVRPECPVFYWLPIPDADRAMGIQYVVYSYDVGGRRYKGGYGSPYDYLGQFVSVADGRLRAQTDAANESLFFAGHGEGPHHADSLYITNHTPVKIPIQGDNGGNIFAAGNTLDRVADLYYITNHTPVKIPVYGESFTAFTSGDRMGGQIGQGGKVYPL